MGKQDDTLREARGYRRRKKEREGELKTLDREKQREEGRESKKERVGRKERGKN